MVFVWIALGIFVYLLIGAVVSGLTSENDDKLCSYGPIIAWPLTVFIVLPMRFIMIVAWWVYDVSHKD